MSVFRRIWLSISRNGTGQENALERIQQRPMRVEAHGQKAERTLAPTPIARSNTMLEYTLEDNELTNKPGDLRAQVVNVTSYTQNDIVDRVLNIGAGLTRSDVVSVFEAEKQVIESIIAEGGAVNTELFNAFPSISGVFDTPDEPFDHTKHKVNIKLHPGVVLRSAIASVKTRRIAAAVTGTVITSVTDLKTGLINGTLTPGRDVKLSGAKLKIAGDKLDVGLYFVPAGSGAEVKVDPSDIVVNNPSEVIAVIPALPAGTYRVRIITQFSAGKHLKTPHTYTFDKDLTVLT
ncbi:MAG: DUF4469 domain-containing protein [Treponema sp.]|jgi:hypothetical protein|nr:DUF4469 domain-containing protein [Treponema sp.]